MYVSPETGIYLWRDKFSTIENCPFFFVHIGVYLYVEQMQFWQLLHTMHFDLIIDENGKTCVPSETDMYFCYNGTTEGYSFDSYLHMTRDLWSDYQWK